MGVFLGLLLGLGLFLVVTSGRPRTGRAAPPVAAATRPRTLLDDAGVQRPRSGAVRGCSAWPPVSSSASWC